MRTSLKSKHVWNWGVSNTHRVAWAGPCGDWGRAGVALENCAKQNYIIINSIFFVPTSIAQRQWHPNKPMATSVWKSQTWKPFLKQWLRHWTTDHKFVTSNSSMAKLPSLDPLERPLTFNCSGVSCFVCKSFWINVAAKWANVNVKGKRINDARHQIGEFISLMPW